MKLLWNITCFVLLCCSLWSCGDSDQVKSYIMYDNLDIITEKGENVYDGKGHKIKTSVFDRDGVPIKSVTFEYQVDLLIKQTEYATGNPLGYIEYGYDVYGNKVIESRHYQDGTLLGYNTFNYDEQNREIGMRKFNSDSLLVTEWTDYEYNDQGLLKRKFARNSQQDIQAIYTFAYDQNGNEVFVKWDDSEGFPIGSYRQNYDDQNRKIERISYDAAGGINYRTTYGY